MTNNLNWPRYQSQKYLRAVYIAEICPSDIGSLIIPQEADCEPVHVTPEFVERHSPEVGGVLVQYESGYLSYCPGGVFALGNFPMDGCNTFGAAIGALRAGYKVRRRDWNGKGLWLELQEPDEYSLMTLPYLFLNYPDDAKTTPGARVPWSPTQTDVLAMDWQVLE